MIWYFELPETDSLAFSYKNIQKSTKDIEVDKEDNPRTRRILLQKRDEFFSSLKDDIWRIIIRVS